MEYSFGFGISNIIMEFTGVTLPKMPLFSQQHVHENSSIIGEITLDIPFQCFAFPEDGLIRIIFSDRDFRFCSLLGPPVLLAVICELE